MGNELADTPLNVRIGAGTESGREAVPDVVVIGELGEVLMGEVGSAVQLPRLEEAADLGSLALAAAVDRR